MIVFAQGHLGAWDTNKAALGLSEPDITALTDAIEAATAALDAADGARIASKGATTTFKTSSRSLRTLVSDAVRTIQFTAKSTENPSLYGLADIPEPQPRSAHGPTPGKPGDIRAFVNANGSITLTWKSNNPAGCANVIFQIKRSLDGSENFTLVDTVGERTFNDATIPVGATSVSYIITGKRGGMTGPMSDAFTARFGSVGGGGGFSITSTESAPMKIAA